MTTAGRTEDFEGLRPHLLAVAYRLTGTFADAEDAVQDAGCVGMPSDRGAMRSPTLGPG